MLPFLHFVTTFLLWVFRCHCFSVVTQRCLMCPKLLHLPLPGKGPMSAEELQTIITFSNHNNHFFSPFVFVYSSYSFILPYPPSSPPSLCPPVWFLQAGESAGNVRGKVPKGRDEDPALRDREADGRLLTPPSRQKTTLGRGAPPRQTLLRFLGNTSPRL